MKRNTVTDRRTGSVAMDNTMGPDNPPRVLQAPAPPGNSLDVINGNILGTGGYGTVYKAIDAARPSQYVALKKIRTPLTAEGVPAPILREIGLLRHLDRFQHPNIVRFLDVCHGPRHGILNNQNIFLFIVFEYVEMDLAKYISKAKPIGISPANIKDIMFQVLCGVDFLHSQRIVHRDLKPENVLISEAGQVKLADFGLAKVYDFEMKLTNVVATLWYRPPEVLLGSSYGTSVDVWSVGCIFAELVRGSALLHGVNEKSQLEAIFDLLGTPPDSDWPRESRILPSSFHPRPPKKFDLCVHGLDPVGQALLQQMLTFDHIKRITASDALRHAYFQNRPIPKIELSPIPSQAFLMPNAATTATSPLATSTAASSSRWPATTLTTSAAATGNAPYAYVCPNPTESKDI